MKKGFSKKKSTQEVIELRKRLGIPLSVEFKETKVVIGIPSRGMLSTHFLPPLLKQSMPINIFVEYCFVIGKEVGLARNELVEKSLKLNADYLLFIDDDVIIPQDAVARLINLVDEGRDIVAGVYYSKQIPPQPLIFKGIGTGCFSNWKVGEILENVSGVGMGLTIIKTDVFRKLKRPWFKTINSTKFVSKEGNIVSFGIDEALYFCYKALSCGFRISVDTSIQGIHYDFRTDRFYFNSKGKPVVVKGGTLIFPTNPYRE
ncbi:MAG: hypothetical protein Q7S14_01790 [bacterium]|nr:hypothetical protein [bacterium]